MAPPAPITALSASTTSQLRSGIVIPSLPAVLIELVQNSLDARARSIQVVLDLERWSIRCDDDGCGLARDDLRRVGRERYWTSKADGGHETFGFRGEALSSIGEVAVLELLTRRDAGDGESYSLVVRDGKVAFEGLASTKRVAGGTTVWARDIFYKWPVRRRPYATPTARASLVASFRHALSTLSLLHPLVSFSLTETSDDALATGGARRLVGVARSTEGVLGRWRQLWGRAGVESVVKFDSPDDKGELRAEGFFSLTASHSRASQFIFVNSRPLPASPLQKLVNTLFLSSTFSRHTTSHLVAPLASPSKTSDREANESTKASRKSPKKAAERHPIFVLHLTAPPAMVDVALEPEKRVVEFQDEKRVFAFIEDVVKSFLRAHGFLAVRPSSASPSKPPSSFDPDQSEVMVPPLKKQRLESRPATPIPAVERAPAYDLPLPDTPPRRHKGIALIQPELRVFPEADTHSHAPVQPEPTAPAHLIDQPIQWTDPTTRQTFLIDPRTGNSWNQIECSSCDRDAPPESAETVSGATKWDGAIDRTSLRTQVRGEGEAEAVVPDWMRQTLQNWENPVFARADALVPALRPSLSALNDPSHSRSHPHHQHQSGTLSHTETTAISAFFSAPGSSTLLDAPPTRFSRESLQRAKFVAQVDRKFLLATLDDTLVMVDQHAADERVRVERFLAELAPADGEVERWKFAEPVPVVVSREEAILVAERRLEFERWGVGIETKEGGEMDDYRQVYLTSVPLVVADRLKVESRLQQELVRSHVSQLGERGSTVAAKGARPWASVLRECPPVLLDLVNSKACRGAIMFNDSLTPAQGATLLARLAETAFPFQCAHGRPSLIPIVKLPTPSTPHSIAAPASQRCIDWSLLKP